MITEEQLDILKDIFSQYDDGWLLSHLSVRQVDDRNFVIAVDNARVQDCGDLFPGHLPGAPGVTK